jgi:ribosomal protein S18 acetylase RimI-like enzyme
MDGAIEMVPAYDHKEEIRVLFGMYTDMLVKGDPEFKKFLQIQRYDEELADPGEKYGMPDGRLYLAYTNGRLAGCIGLRKIDDKRCELKRLYVKPEFRRRHIGREMLSMLIEQAKQIGYEKLLLDTLPFLESALKMYEQFGFKRTERHNNSPLDSSIYMTLDLSDQASWK